MDYSDDLFNTDKEKKMAINKELQEIIDSIGSDDYKPHVGRYEVFEMNEELVEDIYHIVKCLLNSPATYQLDSICGGYDEWDEEFMNILFPKIEQKFYIAIFNDEAHLDCPSHVPKNVCNTIPNYEYKCQTKRKW
jgi:hypothetical protein